MSQSIGKVPPTMVESLLLPQKENSSTQGGSFFQKSQSLSQLLSMLLCLDTNTMITPIALEKLLPNDKQSLYRFEGSLTTPGCFETVTWSVFSDSVKISPSQVGIQKLYFAENKNSGKIRFVLVNNYVFCVNIYYVWCKY